MEYFCLSSLGMSINLSFNALSLKILEKHTHLYIEKVWQHLNSDLFYTYSICIHTFRNQRIWKLLRTETNLYLYKFSLDLLTEHSNKMCLFIGKGIPLTLIVYITSRNNFNVLTLRHFSDLPIKINPSYQLL